MPNKDIDRYVIFSLLIFSLVRFWVSLQERSFLVAIKAFRIEQKRSLL